MKIFLDTADLNEIRKWQAYSILDGVTTNPSIMLKYGGYDMEVRAKEICQLVHPCPVSVEVTSNDHAEMLAQGRLFATWADNVVVKIPVINEYGEPSLDVVRTLVDESIKVNMTACLSFGQVVLGAKAGATYISIFGGRVSDEGHDASEVIRNSVEWLTHWDYPSEIIVGSIRTAMDVQEAVLAGAHIVTTPPKLLEKFIDHHYSRETVRGFNEDAQKALAKMAEAKMAETELVTAKRSELR
ncbi:MAG: transaldolase [Chloroflexi bacterium]|nr:transaldolase [Chloroflexota bacterium]